MFANIKVYPIPHTVTLRPKILHPENYATQCEKIFSYHQTVLQTFFTRKKKEEFAHFIIRDDSFCVLSLNF